MAISVKHRRATRDEWLEYDPVIPDGELALTKTNNGYGIRIGDGVKRYSQLTDIEGEVHMFSGEYEYDLILKKGDDVRLLSAEVLNVTFYEGFSTDFYAILSFDCDDPATMISFPDNWISFTGADVSDGVFTPTPYNRYTLFFWYDGSIQCSVRAYYYG